MTEKGVEQQEIHKPPRSVIFFTVLMTVFSAAVFIILLLALTTEKLPDGSQEAHSFKASFALTVCTMFVAGMLGGCLYSFRGITLHASRNDYSRDYDLTYYLKPLSSGISGLLVFFLLLGGALTLNINTSSNSHAWQSFSGRMPYITFSLLAGYGSHEFMLKLKDLAVSLFAVSGNQNK